MRCLNVIPNKPLTFNSAEGQALHQQVQVAHPMSFRAERSGVEESILTVPSTTPFVRSKILRQKAFTLIELLVVLTVIALLAGLLMPSLVAARRLGKRLVCLSNLRPQRISGWP